MKDIINLTDGNTTREQRPLQDTLKAQLQDLQAFNYSMITDDPNHIPRFTDGTPITTLDLADMNINAIDNIAELLGFELEQEFE